MSAPLIPTASLGFPRIGPRRELKTAPHNSSVLLLRPELESVSHHL